MRTSTVAWTIQRPLRRRKHQDVFAYRTDNDLENLDPTCVAMVCRAGFCVVDC